MKYVLDSSVAFKWVVPEIHSDKAIRLRDDSIIGQDDLIAPDIFPIELAHALTRAERQGRITPPMASMHWADVMTTAPQLESSLALMPRALMISSSERLGVYDCLYLALAELEPCQCITADDKLVNRLQSKFPFLIALAARP